MGAAGNCSRVRRIRLKIPTRKTEYGQGRNRRDADPSSPVASLSLPHACPIACLTSKDLGVRGVFPEEAWLVLRAFSFRLFCKWTRVTGESQALCFGPRSFTECPAPRPRSAAEPARAAVTRPQGPCSLSGAAQCLTAQSGAEWSGRGEVRARLSLASDVKGLNPTAFQIQPTNYPIIDYSIFQLPS